MSDGAGPADGLSAPTAGLVARRFAALGLGEAVARLVAFGATVYAARVLGASQFGVLGVAAAITLYLNRIVDGGFELGLGVREIAADPGFVQRAAPTVQAFRTLVALIVTAGVVGIALLAPQPDGAVLAVQSLTLLAVGVAPRWIHLGLHRTGVPAIATALGQLVMAGLVLALVREAGDLAGVAQAQVVGDLAAAAIMVVALRRLVGPLRLGLDFSLIRPLVRRSASLVGAAIAGIVIYNADFLFLRVLRTSAAVGLYAVAYTLVTFFFNVGATYNLSLLPAITRVREDPPVRDTLFRSAAGHVFAVGFPLALGGMLLARPIVTLLFGPGYAGAALPLAILVWCIPLNLLRDVPLMGLLSEGREAITLRITVRAAVLNLLLNVALIPPFGLAGAAAASLATEAIRMGLAFVEARAVGFPIPGMGQFARAGLAGLAMGGALWLAAPSSALVGIPLGGAIYLIALTIVGGIRVQNGRPMLAP